MNYEIPVSWTMAATLNIEANSMQEAIEKAKLGGNPLGGLPKGEYLADSFAVDVEIMEDSK